MSSTCPAVVYNPKHRGRVCGRPIVAFVAPGEGRCAYHATERERINALARRRALVDVRELRAMAPERNDGEPEYDDPPTDSSPEFDVSGFVDATLDEA